MIDGPDGERVQEIAPPEVVLGSDAGCDVVIAGADVSPEHCKISAVMSAWKVVDLESDAGTRVNGRYVNQKALRDGDSLEVGSVRIVFQDAAPAAAPVSVQTPAVNRTPARGGASSTAKKRRSRKPAPSKRTAKRSAPAAGSGRAAGDDAADTERRPRRTRRRAGDTGLKLGLLIGGLIVVAGGAWFAVRDTSSPNQKVFMRMQAADRAMDFQAVVREAQAGDLNDPDFGPRMKSLLEKAQRAVKSDAGVGKFDESVKAWNDLRLWLQADNWKNHDEYTRKLDAFLAEYGHVGGAPVDLARQERARITGSSAAGVPQGAEEAWKRLQMDATALGKNGKFGAAIAKTEEFRKKWGAGAPVLDGLADDLSKSLFKKADGWLGMRISRAWQKAEEGSPFQARKILEKASQNIGIEELEDRAAKALAEILKEHAK